jgi:hypothetical protein
MIDLSRQASDCVARAIDAVSRPGQPLYRNDVVEAALRALAEIRQDETIRVLRVAIMEALAELERDGSVRIRNGLRPTVASMHR